MVRFFVIVELFDVLVLKIVLIIRDIRVQMIPQTTQYDLVF
jgi:hypothetical protein